MGDILSVDDYKKILQFSFIVQNSKSSDFEYYVLKLLNEFFGFEHNVFATYLDDGMVENVFGFNISNKMIDEYMKNITNDDLIYDYVNEHKYLNEGNSYPSVITLSDINRDEKYKSNNRVYHSFLSQNSLHYNMSLIFNNKSEGISLFRAQEKGKFTIREREIAKHLCKIIASHYNLIKENRVLKDEVGLFNKSKEHMKFGFMIFDKDLKLVYFNKMAIDYCCDITGKYSLENVLSEIKEIIFNELNSRELRSSSLYKSKKSYIFEVSAMNRFEKNNIIDIYYMTNIYNENWFKSINRVNISMETYNLTHREKEIVSLVVKGLSNQDIAEKLYISLYTVKVHLKNIYKKLKVNSRTSLITKVYHFVDAI